MLYEMENVSDPIASQKKAMMIEMFLEHLLEPIKLDEWLLHRLKTNPE